MRKKKSGGRYRDEKLPGCCEKRTNTIGIQFETLGEYDEHGHMVVQTVLIDGKTTAIQKRKYYNNCRTVEISNYDGNESLSDRYVAQYDTCGNIVCIVDSHSPQSMPINYKYKYDSKGNVVKKTLILGTDSLFVKSERVITYY